MKSVRVRSNLQGSLGSSQIISLRNNIDHFACELFNTPSVFNLTLPKRNRVPSELS